MRVKKDVENLVIKGKYLLRKGDHVTIISESGNIAIVETADGNRYPCRLDNLENAEIKKTVNPVIKDSPGTTNFIEKPESVTSEKKTKPKPVTKSAAQASQSKLF